MRTSVTLFANKSCPIVLVMPAHIVFQHLCCQQKQRDWYKPGRGRVQRAWLLVTQIANCDGSCNVFLFVLLSLLHGCFDVELPLISDHIATVL